MSTKNPPTQRKIHVIMGKPKPAEPTKMLPGFTPRVTVHKDTRDDYSIHLDEEARDRLGK